MWDLEENRGDTPLIQEVIHFIWEIGKPYEW